MTTIPGRMLGILTIEDAAALARVSPTLVPDPLSSDALNLTPPAIARASVKAKRTGSAGGSGSNTARSMDYLRKLGYVVDRCEQWVPGPPKGKDVAEGEERTSFGHRRDLFGFLDIVALDPHQRRTIGVQTTSVKQRDPHIEKIMRHPNYKPLIAAGWLVHLHCWEKVGHRWHMQLVDCS